MAEAAVKASSLDKLKSAVLKSLEGEGVRVVLFGSRAREDHSSASDVDIGIIPGGTFDKNKLTLLREYIDGLNVPYKVEIVDLSETSEEFRKFAKDYLKVKEGVVCNSPKSCFRGLFSAGVTTEEETVWLLEMTDDRDMTSHTYKEAVSQLIFGKLKGYSGLVEGVIGRFKL